MSLRTLVDSAIADVMAEHPKYFSTRGLESARPALLQKIMRALRDDMKEPTATSNLNISSETGIPTARSVHRTSREAIAYSTLRIVGGAVTPFQSNGHILVPAEAAIPAVWAFADAPNREKWGTLTDRRQIAAWLQFLRDTLPGIPRRDVNLCVPWPWPPNKDGSTHEPEPAPVDEPVDELVDFT